MEGKNRWASKNKGLKSYWAEYHLKWQRTIGVHFGWNRPKSYGLDLNKWLEYKKQKKLQYFLIFAVLSVYVKLDILYVMSAKKNYIWFAVEDLNLFK